MKLIITDTNVFFDLIAIQALPEFFKLDYEICTTDFVVNEILLSSQKERIDAFIRAGKITVFILTSEELDEIMKFHTQRIFKGITDKTVLWKSKQLKCPILTGDRKLRKEAEELGIKVYGSIWVIEQLIITEKLKKEKGVEFLEQLKVVNGSLPQEEIDKLIRKHKK
jgi:predicted nucleic acid-binding protein